MVDDLTAPTEEEDVKRLKKEFEKIKAKEEVQRSFQLLARQDGWPTHRFDVALTG